MRLLQSLEALQTTADCHVIVADNDPDRHEGFNLCSKLDGKSHRWPLKSFVVADRGLVSARNAVIAVAFSDPTSEFVALLDDDECVEPQWLEAMLEMQAKTGADIVAGAVIPEFEKEPSPWMLKSKIYRRDEVTNGPVNTLYRAGNTLIARKILERVPLPFFNPRYSLTGGEDLLFFAQSQRCGVTFARAARGRTFEFYPASRMSFRWALLRAYRVGNNHVQVKRSLKISRFEWLLEFAKICGAILLFPIEFITFSLSPSRRVDALCRLSRALGKIGTLLGHNYEEYRTVHGK